MSNSYWYPPPQYGMPVQQSQPPPAWGWNNYPPNYMYPMHPYPQPNQYYAAPGYGPYQVPQPQPVPPIPSQPQTVPQMTGPQMVPPPVPQATSQSHSSIEPQPVPPIEAQSIMSSEPLGVHPLLPNQNSHNGSQQDSQMISPQDPQMISQQDPQAAPQQQSQMMQQQQSPIIQQQASQMASQQMPSQQQMSHQFSHPQAVHSQGPPPQNVNWSQPPLQQQQPYAQGTYQYVPNPFSYNYAPNQPTFNHYNEGPNQHSFNVNSNQYDQRPNPSQNNQSFNNHYNDQDHYNQGSMNRSSHLAEPWVNSDAQKESSFFDDRYNESPFPASRKRGKRIVQKRLPPEKRAKYGNTFSPNNPSPQEHVYDDNEHEDNQIFEEDFIHQEPPNNGSSKEESVINEATPIPEHLKEVLPRNGTTISSPVVYSQKSEIVEEEADNQADTSSDNIYSLANKYNSVCLMRTEGFAEKKTSKGLSLPSKPPGTRRYNFEEATNTRLFCFMCRVDCANEFVFTSHFIGKKHLKVESDLKRIDSQIMEQLAADNVTNSGNIIHLKCNVCELVLSTVELFKTHLSGFKHKHSICSLLTKSLIVPTILPAFEADFDETHKEEIIKEISEYDENLRKNLSPVSVLGPECKVGNPKNLLVGEKFVVQHKSQPNAWFCRLCKVNLSPSESVRTEHCKGKQHRGNYIYKMSDSDGEAFQIFNGEFVPLKSRVNWKEDCKHYSADPNCMIPFESFLDHPNVPRPLFKSQLFLTNKKICPAIDFSEEDRCLEKKSSEITNGKSAIHELYELVKYISKTSYKITYAINEILLEFKTGESEEVRYRKCLDTLNYNIPNGLLIKQLVSLPANASCYYSTVVRTDIIGKGYILNNEERLNLVMICDFLPTREILKLYEVGFKHILNQDEDRGRTITIMGSSDDSSISILYLSEEMNPIIEIVLNITSKLFSNRDLVSLRAMPNMLNIDKGLEYLSEIRQIRWFKEKHIYYPYFMFIFRILRDFRRRNDPWRRLSLYSMELVMDHLLRNCKTFLSPAVLIKNFFKFFATVQIKTQTLFGDVCEAEYSNPFKHLEDSECEAIQCSAKIALNLLENRKMNSILYYPIPNEIVE